MCGIDGRGVRNASGPALPTRHGCRGKAWLIFSPFYREQSKVEPRHTALCLPKAVRHVDCTCHLVRLRPQSAPWCHGKRNCGVYYCRYLTPTERSAWGLIGIVAQDGASRGSAKPQSHPTCHPHWILQTHSRQTACNKFSNPNWCKIGFSMHQRCYAFALYI